MPFILPFLSIGPKIEVDPQTVTTRTGWIVFTLTLGLWQDRTLVDSRAKQVEVIRRRFWFFPSHRIIPFGDIAHIAYSVIDQGNLLGDGRGGVETFDVALALHTGEEVPLFRFKGDGEFVADVSLTPMEWLADRWREVRDLRGDQQERSLGLAELLCTRIGVPLGPSRYF